MRPIRRLSRERGTRGIARSLQYGVPSSTVARASALALVVWALASGGACRQRSTLPRGLSDRDFWNLIEALSEPPGTFTLSENFVSNEPRFAENIRFLSSGSGAYIGVGPEQNFSYIAAIRPSMAFVVDIRRENLSLHLLYKALFELSSDRVEFVSRLFSRPRPPGLPSGAAVSEIFARYEGVAASSEELAGNLARVHERLLTTRALPLTETDLAWIDRALTAFHDDGPAIQFWGSRTGGGRRPSYRALMTMPDFAGRGRSFLASEENFRFVKTLQERNLIVPVVGDFAGPAAIRRVGAYVRDHAEVVSAFYASNVAVYLTNQQIRTFCRNLATLPAAPGGWYIESDAVRTFDAKLKSCRP